jgi:hypothetical protein
MTMDEVGFLTRPDLPAGFERWELRLPAGERRPTTAGEWAGALVRVESGTLEVRCLAGGHETFHAGDLLALGWLPIVELRNVDDDEVRLLAVRRCGATPRAAYLLVNRATEPTA